MRSRKTKALNGYPALTIMTLGALFQIFGTRALAQTEQIDIQVIGQIGGAAGGGAVSGNYVYKGSGRRLLSFDTSDATNPVLMGKSEPLPEPAFDIVVSGNYAFVANGLAGLSVIDITDPSNLFIAGQLDSGVFGNHTAIDLAFSGNNVVLGYAYSGLEVIDVSNPRIPIHLGRSTYGGLSLRGFSILGNYVYVASYNDLDLAIIDISNPFSPTFASGYNRFCFPNVCRSNNIAVSGNTAYLGQNFGLLVLDLSDPLHPVHRGSFFQNSYILSVAAHLSYAFVSGTGGVSNIIDVSDPMNPTVVGSGPGEAFFGCICLPFEPLIS